ncbi:MAG: hypothetical protein Q7T82_05810 [Armatimonadota bacterium]|nr:hypothetical protein [Armatimonadota bacterium]
MPANALKVGSGGRGRIKALSLAMAILILCSVPVIAAPKITNVQVANLEDKVQVGITATEPIHFTPKQSATGAFLVFDVKGYYMPSRPGKLRVGSDKIYSVKYGRFRSNPPVTRIAFATKGTVSYTTRYLNGQRKLLIDVWKSAKAVLKQATVLAKPVSKPSFALSLAPAAASVPAPAPRPTGSTIAATEAVMGVATPVPDEPEAVVETPAAPTPSDPAPVVVVKVASAPAGATQTSPVRMIRRAAAAPSDSSDVGRNISLDFHAADINDVLKALSLQSGKNIVAGADVKGQVTVTLSRASLDEALQYVAKLSGFKYAKAAEDTYLVGNNVDAAMGTGGSDTTVTEAITLRLVAFDPALNDMLKSMWPDVKIAFPKPPDPPKDVDDTGNIGQGHLKIMVGKPFRLTPPKPLSTVLLTGPAGEVAKVKAALKQMEDSLGQYADGSITEVYRVKSGNATQLIKIVNQVIPAVTVSWATDAVKLEGGDLGNQPDYIVLTGPRQHVTGAIALLNQVDLKPSQILIEAKVMDVANDALRDIGVDWSWSTFRSSQTVGLDNAKGHKLDVVVDTDGNVSPIDTPVNTRVVTRALSIGPLDLLAKLNLMVTTSKAKLLANPKVAALEGKPADIFIGDQIKYIISIQNTPTGQNIQTETANVGIQLRTIGTVAANDEITLNLHPEVSVISSFLNLGNGITLPQIATRFTDSTIRVKSGETVVVGGLIRDQDITTMSKIPFLGDLPFLGQLFRHKSKTRNHSEIVVFITATVLKD